MKPPASCFLCWMVFLLIQKNLLEKAALVILYPLFIADKNLKPKLQGFA